MQLSAPRQGLFALVLFISFVLHAFFTIYSIRTHQTDVRNTQAKLLLSQLSHELAPTVLARDTIGLSLLAKRYEHQQSINSLTVYAKNGDVLSKVGLGQTRNGENYTHDLLIENEPVGKVTLNLKIPSRGDVLSGQWPFFLVSAVLHIALWLLYRLFASQYVVLETLRNSTSHMTRQRNKTASDTRNTKDVQQADASSSSKKSTSSGTADNPIGDYDLDAFIERNAHEENQAVKTPTVQPDLDHIDQTDDMEGTGMTSFLRAVSDQDDPLILQIQFDDPRNLLMKLSPSISTPYYSLCDTLLENAIEELCMSNHIPRGIHFEKTDFAEDGVHIVATAMQDSITAAETTRASFMLAKLYMLLHDVTYSRHREINRFALESKACLSRKLHQPAMAQMLEFEVRANAMLLLLDNDELAKLKGNIDMLSYPNPSTVLQRKVGIVDGISETLIKPLTVLRDSILG